MRVTRSDGIRRRNEILDAALRCFDQRGLMATGIEDIRRAAGASPSSVYHLFGGLGGLTVALLTRTFERVGARLRTEALASATAHDAVCALVDTHLAWVAANRAEARFMYQAMALELAADHAAELAEVKQRLLAPVMSHLARLAGPGELPEWTPEQLQTVLFGPSHDACRRMLAIGEDDLGWARAVLPELAWRSIQIVGSSLQLE
ncbi:TetR/AcrR family transcriptional regulator [Nonomuraea sp. NPDC050394]|uniref:TetR/AcrR family transcriptional regulator n=1 Tax=Nonomuraea sp. NPDC050394 TaxID=3364363 RepID=UPI0037AED669